MDLPIFLPSDHAGIKPPVSAFVLKRLSQPCPIITIDYNRVTIRRPKGCAALRCFGLRTAMKNGRIRPCIEIDQLGSGWRSSFFLGLAVPQRVGTK